MSYNDMSPADIKAVLGNGNYGNNGFGGDAFGFGGLWWILLLLAMGWGGMGGFGGGMGMMWPWMLMCNGNNGSEAYMQRGFDQAALSGAVGNVANAVNAGFANTATQLCGGFAGVNANVNNGFANAETANNARQMANMQQGFGMQTAITSKLDAIAANQAQCCCDNRAAIADLKYTVASENCQDRYEAANNTRDIIDTINNKVQAISDKLCQLELDGVKQNYENRIAGMQSAYNAVAADNQSLRFAQSQAAQNALIQQGFVNEIDALYNRLNNCPVGTVPVYGKQPIFGYSQNQPCGCGYAAS